MKSHQNGPLISVNMAVHNGEKYLRQAIGSVLTQTFTDFEFIIINDGSTDRIDEIIQSYKDERIILINQENKGLTPSLNRGLSLAKGKYIARMDADDESHPERFEKQVRFLEEHPEVGLVGIAGLCMDEDGEVIGRFPPITNDRSLRKILRFGNPFIHGSVMFRRSCIASTEKLQETRNCSGNYWISLRRKIQA